MQEGKEVKKMAVYRFQTEDGRILAALDAMPSGWRQPWRDGSRRYWSDYLARLEADQKTFKARD
jgi:hypothetical protein